MKDAIGLVLRTMSKTMDSTTLSSEKRAFFFLVLGLSSSQDKEAVLMIHLISGICGFDT